MDYLNLGMYFYPGKQAKRLVFHKGHRGALLRISGEIDHLRFQKENLGY